MKEVLARECLNIEDVADRRNRMREFLQYLILKMLDDMAAFESIAFVGGTALRVLYGLNRFSEDLDFSRYEGGPPMSFEATMSRLLKRLEGFGFRVEGVTKTKEGVCNVFIKFAELLQELGISKRHGEKFSIKVEVDMRPPAGAMMEVSPVNKDFAFKVSHHDLPTLFAGKICALLYRTYTKGRDFYDLMWYALRHTPVNGKFLHNAILQQPGKNIAITEEMLIGLLTQKIQAADMNAVVRDLEPFLVYPDEVRVMEKNLLLKAIQSISVLQE